MHAVLLKNLGLALGADTADTQQCDYRANARHAPPGSLGVRTIFTAIVLFGSLLAPRIAWAACPTAPLVSQNDMVLRFPAATGVWSGSASMMASSVQNPSTNVEGVLVYDGTAKTMKLCDGTSWIDLAATGTSGMTALTW